MARTQNLYAGEYTMSNDNMIALENPAKTIVDDQLTQFIRESAQQMLRVAVEAEVMDFINQHQDLNTSDGKRRVVRNGYLPEREVQTGVGTVKVKLPRTRDRNSDGDEVSIEFTSNLIPKYMRRTATLDVLLPLLYLKGISTGDFPSALEPMLGANAKSISPSVISRLKSDWYNELQAWQTRYLSNKHYVYWWVDGIYLKARMEDDKSCVLVIVGADEGGKKELVALIDGYRESKESWLSLLRDLKQRGLAQSPRCAVGDGALGFWGALQEIYPDTKQQRCWVHKTANVLDKLPKSQHGKAKSMIHDIYMAANKTDALNTWDEFIQQYEMKYPKATLCLDKDKDQMLTFYDFPAEHWVHLRTTNPIESTFATVRHRTKKSKNCFSRKTIMASIYKLCMEAEKRWRYLNGKKRLAQVINMEKFINGIHEKEVDKQDKSNSTLAA